MNPSTMKKLILILFLSFLFRPFQGQAQSTPAKPVKIGDSLKDHVLSGVINHPKSQLPLADFQGKLLIMEFWSTTCGACIKMWPKLLELQKKFDGQIQIVLVNTYQGAPLVRKAIEKRKKLAGVQMTLPIACADSVTGKQLFPHSGVPFVVWVDPKGIVRSISLSQDLTEAKIQAMLSGQMPEMSGYIGNNEFIHPDFSKPLIGDSAVMALSPLTHYSGLSLADRRIWPGFGISRNQKTKRSYAIGSNYSPQELYRLAYSSDSTFHGDIELIQLNRVEINLSDSTKYLYQLITPEVSKRKVQIQMQADLQRLFPATVRWEKRVKPCLVLRMQDSSAVRCTNPKDVRFLLDENQWVINGVSVKYALLSLLAMTPYHYSEYPILDETGYKGLLGGINIEADIYDPKKLDAALSKYKMSFKIEPREVRVLVVDQLSEETLQSRASPVD